MTDPTALTGTDDLARLTVWITAGQAALDDERFHDAAEAFGAAAAAMPGEWALHQMTANAWRLAGQIVRARDQLLVAFAAARPADVDGTYALGAALLDAGAPGEARACFEAVVRARPRDPAALGALASAMRADGDPEGAWPLVQRALTLAHKMPALLLTAAQVRHALGDTAGARTWLAKAEKIRPKHHLQQVQLAFTHLLEGAGAEGWRAFEARGLPVGTHGARDWHGEPLEGQTIAVLAEQGLGDLFHFVRYVRRLEAQGAARVVIEAPASTIRLLQGSGFDAVATGSLPATDWSVPLLSLPHRLGSDGDTAAELVPYLRTGEAAAACRPFAPRHVPPRVGVVFKGNPAFLSTALRDLDTAALQMLLGTPRVQWVWLQYGEPLPPSNGDRGPIERPDLSGDWLDTARLLESLDAVVSVDTAVAHLAGAMGLPVFVLVPFAPDWRWGLGRESSAWYPTARLVRQPASRDWAGALARLQLLLHAPVTAP